MKIMACGPITSWKIEEEKLETVTDFILGGSKITVDSDCERVNNVGLMVSEDDLASEPGTRLDYS